MWIIFLVVVVVVVVVYRNRYQELLSSISQVTSTVLQPISVH